MKVTTIKQENSFDHKAGLVWSIRKLIEVQGLDHLDGQYIIRVDWLIKDKDGNPVEYDLEDRALLTRIIFQEMQ